MNDFRDKCDGCHTFKKCRGYRNMILCNDCISKYSDTNIEFVKPADNKQIRYKETTIYDYLEEVP
jgi:hypothetical protein|uniref:Diheme cytochrome c n=1 Tax=Siphoviridae sp. ctGuJ10 TaxID=2825418 RepID=A0A8S5PUG7_9CAUD|nr:MAG TPA: Diheme cytochrome c [Siphoviridae sp. ctGuJ10]